MEDSDNHTSKGELERSLQLIAPCAENGKDRIALRSAWNTRPVIPREVIDDIQRWIESPESRLLWVEGPAFVEFEDVLSGIGLRICAAAEDVGIPFVSFFAKMKYTFRPQNMPMHEAGLISMLYSLISQLVGVIPPSFSPTKPLTENEFRKLDGTTNSIPIALGILKALVSVATPGLIFVLSRFNLVDSRQNLGPLTDMIKILRDQPVGKTLKVLFVTQGNCRSLSETTSMNQRSDATRMVLVRGSSPLPGGSSAQEINIRTGPRE